MEEDLELVKKHEQSVFENEMKKAACNIKEAPQSGDDFFNDEFYYPKKKQKAEIEQQNY